MKTQTRNIVTGLVFSLLMSIGFAANATEQDNDIKYKTVEIDGLNIFYREAGNPNKPTLLLLHGFPTSSHMFRDLIPQLSDQYHLVAPDYPGLRTEFNAKCR